MDSHVPVLFLCGALALSAVAAPEPSPTVRRQALDGLREFRLARTRGMRNRSYGVNTGGLYDLYRRPKLAVEEVRKVYAK